MKIANAGRVVAALLVLIVAACSQPTLPADPAIWRVEGKAGETAWLLGTIHAAKQPLDWRTREVDAALDASDVVLVEVADLADDERSARIFAQMSHDRGLPPLSDRLPRSDRAALSRVLDERNMEDTDFRAIETWAAALMLARSGDVRGDPRNGVDRAVIEAAAPRPVHELEGTRGQLALFDTLPERDQQAMLLSVVREADSGSVDLVSAWRSGDVATMERSTREGLLADDRLRAVLVTGRNSAWLARIRGEMAAGRKPFVAVGAAHMLGPDGLVAMFRDAGYTVTRL